MKIEITQCGNVHFDRMDLMAIYIEFKCYGGGNIDICISGDDSGLQKAKIALKEAVDTLGEIKHFR